MQRTPPCPRCRLLPAPPKGEDASRRLLSSLASCRAPKASGPENVSPVAEGGRFYDGLSRDYSGRVCDHASERREPLQLFRCFRVSGSWSWRGGALERAALTGAPQRIFNRRTWWVGTLAAHGSSECDTISRHFSGRARCERPAWHEPSPERGGAAARAEGGVQQGEVTVPGRNHS